MKDVSMRISDPGASRKALYSSVLGQRSDSVYDVLIALGFSADERVSINTQLPGGTFRSRLYKINDLAGWEPPQDRNVWFGVNPVGQLVRYGRGTEADITRVRTLFADFDVKSGQFEAMGQCGEARLILEETLGIAPVAVIESGHGLQPIWRVASPPGDSNVVNRHRSRDEWKTIYQRWGTLAQDAARQAIWPLWVDREPVRIDPEATPNPEAARATRAITIDNVFNLDRILRCPGSVNWKKPDDPVPVRTRLYIHDGRVRACDLVKGMDDSGIQPLARIGPTLTEVPTSFGEADTWIHEQAGATLDLAELNELPPGHALAKYFDVAELTEIIGEGDGAHTAMRDKVMHAVLAAQEGRAGLVVALNNIGEAYQRVMVARGRGQLAGEPRDPATAAREWENAVRGAVAKARGRKLPDAEGWAPNIWDTGPGPEAEGETAMLRGSAWRLKYRPAYQPRYRQPWRA